MKLASLYIIKEEMKKKGYDTYNYGYRPMYERNSSSSYRYREPMYYTEDLMIGRQHDHMYENQGQNQR